MKSVLRRASEDEEESVFVSMTDMTVSFLFIVMVLLAFFASQWRVQDNVPRVMYDAVVAERNSLIERNEELLRLLQARDQKIAEQQLRITELEEQLARMRPEDTVEAYLVRVAEQRRRILESLKTKLQVDFPDLQVVISDEMDALRFKGDGLFQTNASDIRPEKLRMVEGIATRLKEVLPCYTLGKRSLFAADCNDAGAAIEAIQIEGHTDSDGAANNNMTLSTNRADQTFFAMTKKEPTLVEFLNNKKQPILSVSGYGRMRPVAPNDTLESKATNRRIDLRIIMYTPQSLEDIRKVRELLRTGLTPGGQR